MGIFINVLVLKLFAFALQQKRNFFQKLLGRINGKLLTTSKHALQLCTHFYLIPIIPNKQESMIIIKNTAWLSGLFDAEGHFNVMNKSTLGFHISKKENLEYIYDALQLGHIRHDSSWNGWTYSITDKEGIRHMLSMFNKHSLHTLKQIDVFTFSRLLYFIDHKYHLKTSPFAHKFTNLVSVFNKRLLKLSVMSFKIFYFKGSE